LIYKNQQELNKALEYWKRVLRLQDWDIKAEICRQKDIDIDDAQGQCNWVLEKKQAYIRILDPIDYPSTRFEQNHEETLVHELLHLHFAPFDAESELEHILQHQAIVAISRALVELKNA